jgi:hypothetical protein
MFFKKARKSLYKGLTGCKFESHLIILELIMPCLNIEIQL